MRQAITAVYENGMFIPTTKVDLPEHTTVKISIPSVVSSTPSSLNFREATRDNGTFSNAFVLIKSKMHPKL